MSAGIAAFPVACASPARETDAPLDLSLIAAPRTFEPYPGKRLPGLAFNGSIPGPVIRVARGQRLRARLHNHTANPMTIHWHGLNVPNGMDGVEGVTQAAVAPGQSFLYEFAAEPAGTRWYHDHLPTGLYGGLFGAIVVDGPNESATHADYVVVLHEAVTAHSVAAAQLGRSGAPSFDPSGDSMHDMAGMDGMRESNAPMGDELAVAAYCMNGASAPHAPPIRVRVGQPVRLRLLNASFTATRYVRLAGHRLTVTHADGNRLARPLEVDVVRLGVGERYDAWFTPRTSGTWLLHAISRDPAATQQAVVVTTANAGAPLSLEPATSLAGLDVFGYEAAGGITAAAWHPGRARTRELALAGGGWGNPRWTIDGKTYPDVPPIAVRRGDRIALRFTNRGAMEHPMHLHGHSFDLVAINGRALARPLRKDTVLVGGNASLTIAFDADAPAGRWLLHCHNSVHMSGGMATEVVYQSA